MLVAPPVAAQEATVVERNDAVRNVIIIDDKLGRVTRVSLRTNPIGLFLASLCLFAASSQAGEPMACPRMPPE